MGNNLRYKTNTQQRGKKETHKRKKHTTKKTQNTIKSMKKYEKIQGKNDKKLKNYYKK